MLGSILFMVLAAIFSSVAGFLACLGILIGDPVLYNRLSSLYWMDSLLELFIVHDPRKLTVYTAIAAIICLWTSIAILT